MDDFLVDDDELDIGQDDEPPAKPDSDSDFQVDDIEPESDEEKKPQVSDLWYLFISSLLSLSVSVSPFSLAASLD